MGLFECYLIVWVVFVILVGMGVGVIVFDLFVSVVVLEYV